MLVMVEREIKKYKESFDGVRDTKGERSLGLIKMEAWNEKGEVMEGDS